jgi:hypothetical protein
VDAPAPWAAGPRPRNSRRGQRGRRQAHGWQGGKGRPRPSGGSSPHAALTAAGWRGRGASAAEGGAAGPSSGAHPAGRRRRRR